MRRYRGDGVWIHCEWSILELLNFGDLAFLNKTANSKAAPYGLFSDSVLSIIIRFDFNTKQVTGRVRNHAPDVAVYVVRVFFSALLRGTNGQWKWKASSLVW